MSASPVPYRRSARTLAQFGVFEAVLRASAEMERDISALLKSHDLSPAQYNVLRILRGAGGEGLSCSQVGGRLMRHDPDITRLSDRLEKRGLIDRVRDLADRRIVRTRLTPAGLELIAKIDAPLDAIHERRFGHVPEARLEELRAGIYEACRLEPL